MLDIERCELRRGAEPIALEPQVFDLLVYLVRNRGRVVSKDDLIDAVWGGRIVPESALTTRLNAIVMPASSVGDFGVPKIRALYEATYFTGLRKAGMAEE